MLLYMPTKVFFGEHAVKQNQEALKTLGSKAMIVTGKHSSRINGSLDDVISALKEMFIEWVIFDDIEENPSVESVTKAAAIAAQEHVNFFIAIGGGSAMDASKAISFLARNPESISHAEERLYDPKPMQAFPIAAIPTTCGTGSEVTQYSILTLHSRRTKQSIAQKKFADIAFVDARYLRTSSEDGMINTCVDALAHLMESYLNTNANVLNQMYASEGLRIWGGVKEYLLQEKSEFPDTVYEDFMRASLLAGISIAHTGTSIPHGLSYPVTYELGIAHGRAVGYFLPGFLKNYEDQEAVGKVLALLGFECVSEFELYLSQLIGTLKISNVLWKRDMEALLANPAKLKNYPFKITADILEKYR